MNGLWIRGKSTCYLYLLFCWFCFLYGGWFSYFQGKPSQNLTKSTRTERQMFFCRFLINLVPLDLHYCGFHFGSRLQSDGDMVVTNIFVTLDECVKQSVTHTSNTASNILLQSSLWWVFPIGEWSIRSWKLNDHEKFRIVKSIRSWNSLRSWLKVYDPGVQYTYLAKSIQSFVKLKWSFSKNKRSFICKYTILDIPYDETIRS